MTILKDLHDTAFAAAEAVAEAAKKSGQQIGGDILTTTEIKLKAFADAEHQRIDFPRYEIMFQDALALIRNLQAPAPSATAAAQQPTSPIAKAAALILLLALMLFGPRASAQIWLSSVNLTGTNNAPVYTGFFIQTNQAYVSLSSRTLVVQNINTNEAIYVGYGVQAMGAAGTNLVAMQGFWTNFPASAGWTNGSTWYYTVPAATYTPAIVPWGTLSISNGQYPSGSCTNPVSFY